MKLFLGKDGLFYIGDFYCSYGITETAAAAAGSSAAAAAASSAAYASATAASAASIGGAAAASAVAEGAADAAASASLIGGISSAFSAVSTLGTLASGFAQSQNAAYQASISAANQSIDQINAQTALQQGQSQVQQQQMKTAAVIGSQIVGQAAGNIDVNSGSALDVRSSAAALGELSALNIGYNAQTKAQAYLSEAGVAGAQSSMYSAQETPDLLSGLFNPNASIIGSASSFSKSLAGSGLI
jgi:hypothetical protein